ncbi:MAG: DUF192 domain-containing protein [Verrucomicrobiia bacterium]
MKRYFKLVKKIRENPVLTANIYGAILILFLLLTGCGQKENQSSQSTAAQSSQTSAGHLDHAQPKLPQIKLWLGDAELLAEVASTSVELQTGMMFRKEMGENEAMLFVFQVPHQASFYMKNTYIPLSAAYINSDGVILEIHDLEPLNEKPVTATNDNIQFVLEVNKGWFQKHNINPGTVIRTPKGSLYKTFFSNGR